MAGRLPLRHLNKATFAFRLTRFLQRCGRLLGPLTDTTGSTCQAGVANLHSILRLPTVARIRLWARQHGMVYVIGVAPVCMPAYGETTAATLRATWLNRQMLSGTRTAYPSGLQHCQINGPQGIVRYSESSSLFNCDIVQPTFYHDLSLCLKFSMYPSAQCQTSKLSMPTMSSPCSSFPWSDRCGAERRRRSEGNEMQVKHVLPNSAITRRACLVAAMDLFGVEVPEWQPRCWSCVTIQARALRNVALGPVAWTPATHATASQAHIVNHFRLTLRPPTTPLSVGDANASRRYARASTNNWFANDEKATNNNDAAMTGRKGWPGSHSAGWKRHNWHLAGTPGEARSTRGGPGQHPLHLLNAHRSEPHTHARRSCHFWAQNRL